MRQATQAIAVIVSMAFLCATAWSVIMTGLFEPAGFGAHFEAGAGNDLLLVRGALALGATLLLLAAAATGRRRRIRWAFAAAALLVLPIFVWSCVGPQRWAPGYSEAGFQATSDRFHAGRTVTERQVLVVVGSPLFSERTPDGEEFWSFSYMPSGGFGWTKRIIQLRDGVVVGMYGFDEP